MDHFLEQSLLEQVSITEREIAARKDLFDFTADDVGHLMACRPFIAEKGDWIARAPARKAG